MKNNPDIFLFTRLTEGDAKALSRKCLAEASEAFFRKIGKSPEEICYTDLGKPYFPSKKYFLSVTHTGSLFAAVFAPFPVGIDGEKAEETRDRVAKRYFSPEERRLPFARVWTAKEAVAKIDGRGLFVVGRIAVRKERAFFESESFLLFEERVGEYLLTVAIKEEKI